jgi:hypothetical protein
MFEKGQISITMPDRNPSHENISRHEVAVDPMSSENSIAHQEDSIFHQITGTVAKFVRWAARSKSPRSETDLTAGDSSRLVLSIDPVPSLARSVAGVTLRDLVDEEDFKKYAVPGPDEDELEGQIQDSYQRNRARPLAQYDDD